MTFQFLFGFFFRFHEQRRNLDLTKRKSRTTQQMWAAISLAIACLLPGRFVLVSGIFSRLSFN